jgi:DNA ligase 1
VTLLAELVRTSQRVGSTTARRSKVQELAWLLKSLAPDELDIGVHYLSGEIPQGKIGIGYAAVRAAAAAPAARVETLSIVEADRRLAQLADVRGVGSAALRGESLQQLFSRSTRDEQQFLLRLLIGELRQGALAGVMVDAIAAAADLPVAPVRRAAMYGKSLGEVAAAAFAGGVEALQKFQLEIFSPVSPMLAQTAADVAEALQEIRGPAAFEWKMDGARIQLHKRGGEVRIYTRGLNEITAAIPEIAELASGFPQQTLVLDGEAIAFDSARRPQPFQVTMRRFGRKLNVETLRRTLPIEAFFFDCLRIGDDSIATQSTQERYEALTRAIPPSLLIPRLVTDSETDARAFYEAAIAAGHEGIMAKALDAPYEAGNRGASWLKIKRVHTLDLVVLAAEWGNGRRSGKLSNLHLGALDPATGEYIMLGKTFKGLTDAMLAWQTEEFLKREIRRDAATVYIRPEIVVEIAFSDLQSSSRYPGGVALRLARVKRYRDDKRAEEADTMESVRKIFSAGGQPGHPAAEQE